MFYCKVDMFHCIVDNSEHVSLGPDRILGGLEPSNSDAQLSINREYNDGEISVLSSRLSRVIGFR